MAEDGSVVVVGGTIGEDVTAIRFDANGEEVWRFEVGFPRGAVRLLVRLVMPRRASRDRLAACHVFHQ